MGGLKIEKSNEIEKPGEVIKIGETVEITNPIVVYSDVPGAGPEDEGLTEEELEEAQVQGEATAKAMKGPPQNKALVGKQTK